MRVGFSQATGRTQQFRSLETRIGYCEQSFFLPTLAYGKCLTYIDREGMLNKDGRK